MTRCKVHAACRRELECSVGHHIRKKKKKKRKKVICGLPVVTDLMSEFYSKCNLHCAVYEKDLADMAGDDITF